MKAKRLNVCPPVRNTLFNMGISTVKLVNAVNAELGKLESTSEESKLGDGRVTKTNYKVTETVTSKYAGERANAPLLFDAWHSQVEKANKIASFESITIPGVLTEWVNKFKVEAKEIAAEKSATIEA